MVNQFAIPVPAALTEEFMVIAAHELRRPLTVISGYAQILLMQLQRREAMENETRTVQGILAQTKKQEALIADLLDAVLLCSNEVTFMLTPVDLGVLLDGLVDQWRTRHHQFSFILRTPSKPVMVKGDLQRLEQIFGRLLSNAVAFSTTYDPIRCTVEGSDGEAIVRIEDHGAGIGADDLPHIFKRFYRGANASEVEGNGLSLFLAERTISLHGGAIRVSSAPGHGSVFEVVLPRTG